jgi:omega-amidase
VLAEAGHEEEIITVDIDPETFTSTRAGIPVTRQRRFDVYSEVSAKLNE